MSSSIDVAGIKTIWFFENQLYIYINLSYILAFAIILSSIKSTDDCD